MSALRKDTLSVLEALIYRQDPCEFCLCLDGEMFCWWQDCPPAMEGPCRDRGPFSPCISIPANPQLASTSSSTASTVTTNKATSISSSSTAQTTSYASSNQVTDNFENLTDSSTYTEYDFSSEPPEISTAEEPKRCVVMGKYLHYYFIDQADSGLSAARSKLALQVKEEEEEDFIDHNL
ncbi:hypothetical protein NQ315_001888 [Exocentrus adspersus]|uniref:Uncharacterized protein n=1 Tax=Exocentrus adspersus TaxID=1586481 RepID=A0AAV8WBE4_9CUCU|nr:hypothetical protein NQ315_001888 [Exocentrus adspersus]